MFCFDENSMLAFTVTLLLMGGVVSDETTPPNEEAGIVFKLYTRAHSKFSIHLDEEASNLQLTDFNQSAGTVVIVHGFAESHDSATIQAIRDGYLETSGLNVIVMDWWLLARGPHYDIAAENTKKAAETLAHFLDNLIKSTDGAALHGLHVVGFSLGAQVAGLAAPKLTSGTLPRITALDPAKPIFELREEKDRLNSDDAEFVQVIHTASGFLSFMEPIGHVDFYPNGGKSPQPACSGETALVCSHGMACMYFAESIRNPLSFPSTPCDSWSNFKRGRCHTGDHIFMGAFTPNSARGIFYLKTNPASPYGQGINNKSAYINQTSLKCSHAQGNSTILHCGHETVTNGTTIGNNNFEENHKIAYLSPMETVLICITGMFVLAFVIWFIIINVSSLHRPCLNLRTVSIT